MGDKLTRSEKEALAARADHESVENIAVHGETAEDREIAQAELDDRLK